MNDFAQSHVRLNIAAGASKSLLNVLSGYVRQTLTARLRYTHRAWVSPTHHFSFLLIMYIKPATADPPSQHIFLSTRLLHAGR